MNPDQKMRIEFSTDYYPFGQPMPERNFNEVDYRFGFNGQEKDNEFSGSDGTHYEFEFREYDSRIGRFWKVDPLFRDYPWNSPYAFAENIVISCIDLEGLEAKIAIAGKSNQWNKSAINSFYARAKRYEKIGFQVEQAETGKQIVAILANATKVEGGIQSIVIFSHGGPSAIYLNNNEGFYSKDPYNSDGSSSLTKAFLSGGIKFASNASIVFGSCNAGRSGGIAEDITMSTGVTTIASSGSVAPEVIDGKETGRLTTFKKHDGDPDASFYKIERVTTTKTIKLFGSEFNYKKNEIKRTDLGKTIDPKEYFSK